MRGMLGNVFSLRGEVLWGVKEREEVIPNEDLGKGLKDIYIGCIFCAIQSPLLMFIFFN